MNREFHITGPCLPERHFMADNSGKLAAISKLIEQGKYFVMNRPRQYGKTTTIFSLANQINAKSDFLALNISFESLGTLIPKDEKAFCQTFFQLLAKRAKFEEVSLSEMLFSAAERVENLEMLSDFISEMVKTIGKKVVLLIDEVDSSSSYEIFLSFLGILRSKFLNAAYGLDATFHSVVLAGVNDIKSLKTKVREKENRELNSPWNIAVDFEVQMSFSAAEIQPMLEDYSKERKVKMEVTKMAEKIYEYSSGYPFLVSKLCKTIDEQILPQKAAKEWTENDLNDAVALIIQEDNFNFDSLIKNLENNKDLYKMVFEILISGHHFTLSKQHPITQMGIRYGILKNGNGIRIHNKIYEQVIYNYMTFQLELNALKHPFEKEYA